MKEPEQEEPECSELEYYDSKYGDCLCIDGYMWDPSTNNCTNIQDLVKDCGIGQFLWSGYCLSCNSNDNEGLCVVCTGPEPEQCSECAQGYYMDLSSYSCLSCGEGCSRCATGSSCD